MDAPHEDYTETNRARWDEIATLHVESYDAAGLVADPAGLSAVVATDAALLAPFVPGGTVAGLDLVHLQCHIGTDTLSWARLGARVTGVDFSGESLRIARELSAAAGVTAEYVQASIAEAAAVLAGRAFDVVYTSIGALAWLEDLEQWARLVAGLLRPGGVFFLREGHPMALCLDVAAPPGELRLDWPYFNTGAHREESPIDYSSPVPVRHERTYEWAHPLGEVLGALLGAGLALVDFREYDTLPWKLLSWMEPVTTDEAVGGTARDGDYRLPLGLRDRCPLAFSLVARAPDGAARAGVSHTG